VALIVRALYGLKSSGAMWRAHFAATLREEGFQSSYGDPDVWFRPATTPEGKDYYEYILVYVDDLLIISHKPKDFLDILEMKYKYKLKDVGPPKRYLGAIIENDYEYDVGLKGWSMSAKDYLSKALPIVEKRHGTLAVNRAVTPLPPGYHPELDTSPFLYTDGCELYQSYIGTLRWAVELGRIDLCFPVALMSRFTVAPRKDHFEKVLGMFAYIKKHLNSRIVFDPRSRDWSHIQWTSHNWKEFYPDAEETLPPNAPTPRGVAVQLNMFVDAAHANDYITRRSTTGILIYLQGTPIFWYSKRQNTIESSTFGSEFVALKIATEINEGLRYRLRMMGVAIYESTNTFCDNLTVVNNVTEPSSTLTKKHNAIAYHKVRESVAAGSSKIAHERGAYNVSDMMTKNLPPSKLKYCCSCCLYY
jgi:hypothetical protein